MWPRVLASYHNTEADTEAVQSYYLQVNLHGIVLNQLRHWTEKRFIFIPS